MTMDTHFQKDLSDLKAKLLEMATLVEETLRDAIKALVDRDSELIKKTMAQEDKINQMENAIDEMCLKLLALRQPMAVDLTVYHVGDEDHHRFGAHGGPGDQHL